MNKNITYDHTAVKQSEKHFIRKDFLLDENSASSNFSFSIRLSLSSISLWRWRQY